VGLEEYAVVEDEDAEDEGVVDGDAGDGPFVHVGDVLVGDWVVPEDEDVEEPGDV